ncbi:MAG: hypothetical protein ACR2PH_10365 [Desulfobulbia bacterium]
MAKKKCCKKYKKKGKCCKKCPIDIKSICQYMPEKKDKKDKKSKDK